MTADDDVIDHGISIPDYPRGSILRGVGCSAILHVAVIIAIWVSLLASPALHPLNPPRAILVNLVQLADINTSPPSQDKAQIPQQRTTEQAKAPSPTAIPVPGGRPTPPSARPKAADDNVSAPTDPLTARLEQLSHLQQPAAQLPPQPRDQLGPGLSNISAANDSAVPGTDATYRVKDFLRAQVERRWYVELGGLGPNRTRVSIHILLDPDGTVRSADVVDDPRFRNDAVYQAFADSARNAVLVSSPLTLLPDSYAIAKDIVIDFDARRLTR